jgi:hypothetical protein
MVSEASMDKTALAVKDASARYLIESEISCPKGYKKTEVGVIPED